MSVHNDDANKSEQADKPAVLCTVEDGNEATVLMSLLESCGIPSMKKYKGIGDSVALYMGRSSGNVDILVPSRLLETAREALSAESALDEGMQDGAEAKETDAVREDSEHGRRRTAGWLLALVFILPVAAVIVASVVRLIMRI